MGLTQADVEMLMREEGYMSRPARATASTAKPAASSVMAGVGRNGAAYRRAMKLPITVSVCLAEREMTLKSILEIVAGTIIEFDKPFDAELTLHVGHQQLGTGYAVKVGENFGIRINRVEPVRHRIDALGPG